MKILEVRDGFIKFEADEKICISCFVQIDGIDKSYVAQVIQIKNTPDYPIGYAKILFLYNNGLTDYDKTTPPRESEIKHFPFESIIDAINAEKPVVIGKTQIEYKDIPVDISAFERKTLICTDDNESNNLIIKNLIKEFNKAGKNVIIADTLGRIDAMKYTAGVDFKLPLNTETLNFIYEDCLNDATDESKALIMGIFKDLSEYSKTVPFLPFEALKSIIDDMVDNSHIFQLLVLKNKLSKFSRMGYFASTKEEVEKLRLILTSRSAILDLSKLDSVFQNRYLSFIYETLGATKKVQLFVEMSNTVTKKSLKNILTNESVATSFLTHSKFKYLNDIKNLFDNFIIVPSKNFNEIFRNYQTIFASMNKESFLITGEFTKYIPMVSVLVDFTTITQQRTEDEENKNSVPYEENITNEDPMLEEQKEDISEEISKNVTDNDYTDEELLASLNNDIENSSEDISNQPEVANMFGEEDDDAEETENKKNESEVLEYTGTEEEPVDVIEPASAELPETNISPEENVPFTESFETVEHESNLIIEHNIDLPEDEDVITDENEETIKEAAYEDIEEITLPENFESNIEGLAEQDNEVISEEIQEENTISLINEPEIQEEAEINLGEDITLELEPEEDTFEPNEVSEPLHEQEEISDNNLVSTDSELEVIPVSENEEDFSLEEIQELDTTGDLQADIIVDMGDEVSEEISKDVEEEIARDVDSVYTSVRDDSISDSDLDLIDELNSDDEITLEEVSDDNTLEELSDEENEGIMEPPSIELQAPEEDERSEILETRDSSTPIVPVYDADIPPEDMVMSDPIQQGDSVTHAKYGTGVVEKMIKYGNKTLFSINFDSVGRRLLDPTLTEVKKN